MAKKSNPAPANVQVPQAGPATTETATVVATPSTSETAPVAEPGSTGQTAPATPSSDEAKSLVMSDAPQSGATAGNHSADLVAGNSVGSHAGELAGPAGVEMLEASRTGDLDRADKVLTAIEDKFRSMFPRFAALVDSWQAKNGNLQPAAIRIVSRVDGFRRAGIAHSKAPADHPIDTFTGPEVIEALLSEPNLTVTLI